MTPTVVFPVIIGGLYVGWGQNGEPLGFDGNVVRNSVLGGGTLQNRNGAQFSLCSPPVSGR